MGFGAQPTTSHLFVNRLRDISALDSGLKLTIIVHELLHALYPTASEEHTEQAGKDIAKVLYSLGYREVQDGP